MPVRNSEGQEFMCEHPGEACKNKVFHYLRYKCLSLSEFSSSVVQDAMKISDIALSQKVIAKNFIDNRRFATDREHLDLQRNVQNAEQTINIANCFKHG